MAKVYKVALYIIDYDEMYQDRKHLQSGLKEQLGNLWVGVDHLEIEESEEFEWDDDLVINKTNAKKEEFEAYFNKKEK